MSDQRDGGIAWTDQTWNPVRGCSRVSAGCVNCYAEKVAVRWGGASGPYAGLTTNGRWNGTVDLVFEHLTDPLRWKRPRRVFVNSMSDLFHEALTNEQIAAVFGVMAAAPAHTFQVLTKRAERMQSWFEWAAKGDVTHTEVRAITLAAARVLGEGFAGHAKRFIAGAHGELAWPLANVWLGVSVEDQKTADARIPRLLDTPAAVRFVSYEPALGPVDFTYRGCGALLVDGGGEKMQGQAHAPNQVDWIIVGGESGANARPFDVAWARSTIEQCRAAGVAAFVKQLGSVVRDSRQIEQPSTWWPHHTKLRGDDTFELRHSKGGDPSEWPADLRVREFPAVTP